MSADTLSRVQEVIRQVFADDGLVIHRTTAAADVPGWDSLMHVTIIVNLEQAFGLRFSSAQVAGFKNVGEIVDAVERLTTAGAPA
jgi:acyl carrier protein